MIYIHKANLPENLAKYTKEQIENGLMPLYEGEWDKDEFRKMVSKEQHHLCCYCENTVTWQNSTIEHFLPESLYKEEVANYFNLFLACNYSKGKPQRLHHCDTSNGAKAEKIIPKYIAHPECETFFAYNLQGEILPYCQYKSIESCIKNYKDLTDEQKMVLATIEVLKLNVPSLTQQRKAIYEVCQKEVQEMDSEKMLQEVEFYYQKKSENQLERFCGVYFYLLHWNLKNKGKSKEFEEIVKKWRDKFISSNKNTVISHKLSEHHPQ